MPNLVFGTRLAGEAKRAPDCAISVSHGCPTFAAGEGRELGVERSAAHLSSSVTANSPLFTAHPRSRESDHHEHHASTQPGVACGADIGTAAAVRADLPVHERTSPQCTHRPAPHLANAVDLDPTARRSRRPLAALAGAQERL